MAWIVVVGQCWCMCCDQAGVRTPTGVVTTVSRGATQVHTHTSPPGHCCTYATATTTQPRLNQLGIAEADQENNLGFLDRGDFLPVMSCLRPSRYDVGSSGVGAVGGV